MSTTDRATTAGQLAALADDGQRYELVEGELQMMSPAGNVHGRIAARLTAILWNHVERHQLGVVYAAETGFLLSRDPDTVRAPDVAFIRQERLDQLEEVDGYLPLAPDLAAEVVSPNDSYTQVEEKARSWLRAGSSLVLVVDPGTRSVRVYQTEDHIEVLHEDDTFDAGAVAGGWELRVGDLFR
jgi:Uma2 family endonuclease